MKVGVHQGSVLLPLLFRNGNRLSNGKWKERLDEANSWCRWFGSNGGNNGRIERELWWMERGIWKQRNESQSWKDKRNGEWDEKETFDSKIDSCGMYGTRVMSNLVLCTACGMWVHTRCMDKKKVAVYVNQNFVCKKCRIVVKNFKGLDEKLCDGVETVNKFTYLGDQLNATGGCKRVVTARSRIDWMKFMECSKILEGRRFSLKMKK